MQGNYVHVAGFIFILSLNEPKITLHEPIVSSHDFTRDVIHTVIVCKSAATCRPSGFAVYLTPCTFHVSLIYWNVLTVLKLSSFIQTEVRWMSGNRVSARVCCSWRRTKAVPCVVLPWWSTRPQSRLRPCCWRWTDTWSRVRRSACHCAAREHLAAAHSLPSSLLREWWATHTNTYTDLWRSHSGYRGFLAHHSHISDRFLHWDEGAVKHGEVSSIG